MSDSVPMLLLSRLVLGVSIGVLTFTAPMYLAEIAPERIRGAMVSLYQLMITIGILLAFRHCTTPRLVFGPGQHRVDVSLR